MARLNKNKMIARVSEQELSLYTTLRLAEKIAGIPVEINERASFIRDWAKERAQEPLVQSFLYQGLRLSTKQFGANLRKMEQRLAGLKRYILNTSNYSDKKRLMLALNDLEDTGYVVKEVDSTDAVLNLPKKELAKATRGHGLVLLHHDELTLFSDDGQLEGKDGYMVITVMTSYPGPFIALLDVLKIAGFDVIENAKHQKGAPINIKVTANSDSRFREQLSKLELTDISEQSSGEGEEH